MRRVFVRESDKVFALVGLVASTSYVKDLTDADTGQRFKLAHTTDRYVLYVPDVIEMTPDIESELPDAWKPFVEHGLHHDRQPTS